MLGKSSATRIIVMALLFSLFSSNAYALCSEPVGGYIKCDGEAIFRVFTPEQEKEIMKEVEDNRMKTLEIRVLKDKANVREQKIKDLDSMVGFLNRRSAEDRLLINKLLEVADTVWNTWVCPVVSAVGIGALFSFWEWARSSGGK